jgi:peptide/nickel transport system permease protein
VSVLIFALQQLLPGDPALALAGEDADPQVIAHLREKFHLDEPIRCATRTGRAAC